MGWWWCLRFRRLPGRGPKASLALGDFVLLWLRCWADVVAFLVPEEFFACS